MMILGLTGSIGMGKSTVAGIFERFGVPSHDADKAVHKYMNPPMDSYRAIVYAFPYHTYPELYGRRMKGRRYLKRDKLGKLVFEKKEEREKLERILHPLVRKDQNEFIQNMRRLGRDIVLLDIPLLFETDAQLYVDYTINVSAPTHIQAKRVLVRPNMDADKFAGILDAQMSDREKNLRADYTVQTGLGYARTVKDIQYILQDLRQKKSENHGKDSTRTATPETGTFGVFPPRARKSGF